MQSKISAKKVLIIVSISVFFVLAVGGYIFSGSILTWFLKSQLGEAFEPLDIEGARKAAVRRQAESFATFQEPDIGTYVPADVIYKSIRPLADDAVEEPISGIQI
jgi:hypothetical protein